jgi:hypothetical protein
MPAFDLRDALVKLAQTIIQVRQLANKCVFVSELNGSSLLDLTGPNLKARQSIRDIVQPDRYERYALPGQANKI